MHQWLNYHHLLYFWAVAREGGIVPAAESLRLACLLYTSPSPRD